MYVRLTKTLADKGTLVPAEEIQEHITDFDLDWYYSPFMYDEEALAYYEEHGKSMKGYTGKAFSSTLYWDLDCKEDFEKVRNSAIKLIDFLQSYAQGLEVFFSGNKGIHILLHTTNTMTPQEVKSISQNIAVEAGVDLSVFDTSVYNVNRIFRVPYTKHPESKLYKIPLAYNNLTDTSEEEIREAAKTANGLDLDYDFVEAEIDDLIEHYAKIVNTKTSEIDFQTIREKFNENFNPFDCPPDKRRCIYVLENGFFGAGERENATIRLAAYYHGQNKTREQARDAIILAYEKREANYEDLNPWSEADINRNLDQVYSPNWNGGTYTCRTDDYLRSKCDLGTGCCAEEKKERLNVVTIGGLLSEYEQYGNEALEEYPQTGLAWLDEKVRLRPKNFSIINGANGCVDADTEYLSPEGWKRIADYESGKVAQYDEITGIVSFVEPEEYIKLPEKELIHFKHQYGLDQMLSEEHRMIYTTSRGHLASRSAKEIADACNNNEYGFAGRLPMTYKVDMPGLNISDGLLRIQVAVIADGHFTSKGTNNVSMNLKRKRKIKRLLKLLKEVNIPFKEVKAAKGYRRFSFTAPFKDKEFDSKYYQCSQKQLEIIKEESLLWDGCLSEGKFSTTSLNSAKFIQYAAGSCGTYASVHSYLRKSGFTSAKTLYEVNFTTQNQITLRSPNLKPKKVKTADGFKYCFTVPSSALILRRNKNIFLTGNSGKTSLLIMMLESLNRQQMYHMFFSLDMANTSLLEKLAARHTQYSQREIEAAFNIHTRNPEIIQEVKDVLTEQYQYTLFDFTSTVTSEYIEEAVSKLKTRERDPINIQVAFIDYAGRLTDEKDSEYANATAIALKANDICKKLSIHSVYLSQIPRERGDHTDPIRSSRVAKNSGAFEENATIVLNVWRPFGNGIKGLDNYMHIYIAKNRSGPLGERAFHWNGKRGDIRELDKMEFDEYYKLCEEEGKETPEPQFNDPTVYQPRDDYKAPSEKPAFFNRFSAEDEDEQYLREESERENKLSHNKRFQKRGSNYPFD